ncbi:MAG: adenylosuccinate lyase [Ruegeria sp.]
MIRALLCSIALVLTASAGLACTGHAKQTQSCAEGTIWDSDAQTCVKLVNS